MPNTTHLHTSTYAARKWNTRPSTSEHHLSPTLTFSSKTRSFSPWVWLLVRAAAANVTAPASRKIAIFFFITAIPATEKELCQVPGACFFLAKLKWGAT